MVRLQFRLDPQSLLRKLDDNYGPIRRKQVSVTHEGHFPPFFDGTIGIGEIAYNTHWAAVQAKQAPCSFLQGSRQVAPETHYKRLSVAVRYHFIKIVLPLSSFPGHRHYENITLHVGLFLVFEGHVLSGFGTDLYQSCVKRFHVDQGMKN